MSTNKVDKTTGELVTLANGMRCWIGTKAAHDAAVQAGTMPNNCLVAIVDDWQDATVDVVEDGNMHPVTSNAVYDAISNHELGNAVNLWSYTSTEYTTPSDGYIQAVNDGTANSRVNVYVNGIQMAIVRSSASANFPSASSMFVKKGMRLRHDSSDATGGAFRFYPIVS